MSSHDTRLAVGLQATVALCPFCLNRLVLAYSPRRPAVGDKDYCITCHAWLVVEAVVPVSDTTISLDMRREVDGVGGVCGVDEVGRESKGEKGRLAAGAAL